MKPIKTTFLKMHGLGNDFAIFDQRGEQNNIELNSKIVQLLSNRRTGIGFDQLVLIREDTQVDASLLFFNSDGSVSATCGNATRCIAHNEMAKKGLTQIAFRAGSRILHAKRVDNVVTSVNMGQPETKWNKIPLSKHVDTLNLPIEGNPVATGFGNPHCTFFVNDANSVNLAELGSQIEQHPLFPERTNVQFASLLEANHLRVRVWERGAGITLASGSSSCAAAVAAIRRGMTDQTVKVSLDGGELLISWQKDGVWMAGQSSPVFNGHLDPIFLQSLGNYFAEA